MNLNNREILMYYKPHVKKDKNTYVLAQQVSTHIHDINVLKNPPTETQLKEIVDKLGIPIEEMIETESDVYKEKYEDKNFSTMEWITVLVKNPDMIKTPIVFKGKKGLLVKTPSNVLELDPKHGYSDLHR
jgi:arsenate reductase (glutaredoxin)